MRRPFFALVVAFFLAALLVPATASAQEDDGSVLRIGLHAAEKNLNPYIVPQALPITHDFTMLVYDTLFWSQATLEPEPWLATGAEASDDFRTWTVSLRDGVTWHDGTPFTAEDVAFSFQYTVDQGGPGRYGHHLTDHPTFTSANVIDDLTVELTFADPVATFEMLPGGDIPIIAKHIWEDVEDATADATSLAVGTGPYRMVEYVPGESYRLEANADYFKGAPLVDTLIMPVIRDAQAAFAGLQTGELDFVTRNLPAPLHEPVNGNEELEIIDGSRMQSQYLMFNTRKPGLNDPSVRKAMSMALDVQQIVDIVEGGLGVPGNDTWTHPESEFAHPTGGHEYDPEAAATLLDEAGYTVGDDGVRVGEDGTPLSFTLLVNAAAPPQIRSGELVAEQLEPLGIDITIEPLDAPAIGAQRRPSADGPPTVDMFIAVFESHAHADPDHLFFFFHTPGSGGVGAVFSGYANPEFDGLLEEGLTKPVAEKAALVNQAQDIFAAEAPAVTLYYPNGRWAYRPAAYDGWIADPGHGVFTKRSFLPGYANVSDDAPAEEPDEETTPATEPEEEAEPEPEADETDEAVATPDDDDGGGLSTGVLVALGVAVLGGLGALLALRGRNRSGTVED
ncbi:MAG: ABC transporter substrate-binding protein [Acidimicrobiales bacterium]